MSASTFALTAGRDAPVSGCPRCGSEAYLTLFFGRDRLYRTTDRRFRVVECGSCGMIRLRPLPTPAELAEFYPESYWWDAEESAAGRLAEIYRRLVLADHVAFAAKAVRGSGPVLDIGCGGGLFPHALARRGVRCFGADLSRHAAAICWRERQVPAVCSGLPDVCFRPGSFAAVCLFHVIEHLPNPMAALVAIERLLAPGGRLILQAPNAACWQMLLLGERWNGFDVPRHLIHYRPEDLEELLRAAGFELRRRKLFSLRDNPAGLATSLAPGLDPMARRVRRIPETPSGALVKNLLYFALVVASTPLTLLEAAGGAGSTIMVEAARIGDP